MAKELTHILIAQDVLQRLRDRQPLLAGVIQKNASAYYLGSIFPDALFYDLPPFCLHPGKHLWISKTLHHEDAARNDQTAMGLFSSISSAPHMWAQKIAFSAGIITHTVADRTFHHLIAHYNNAWNEAGAKAMGTHREMETFIDMALLKVRKIHPRKLRLAHYIAMDPRTERALCHFYLAYVTGNNRISNRSLIHVLKRAIDQQRFFSRLFAARPIYHITRIGDKVVSHHLRLWHALFYPDTEGAENFQFLSKLRGPDRHPFDPDGLTFYADAASLEAARCINEGIINLP